MPQYVVKREMEDTFRCMGIELLRMQRALRKESQETTVNGKPLAGELFTEIDKDGSIREAVWDRIARSDPYFEAMLTGARWGDNIPHNFNQRCAEAKHEMERLIMGPYRHRVKMASMRQARVPNKRGTKRRAMHTPEDDPMEGPAPRASQENTQELMRELEEFFIPSVEPMEDATHEASVAPSNNQATTIEAPEQPAARQPLSTTIRNAVEEAVADLKAKVADLEERRHTQTMERERHEAELEEKIIARMESALAKRDAEIEALKRDLAAEKEWRLW